MTARQKQIRDLLRERGSLTSGQIAGILHISDRTVRTDIKEINAEQGRDMIRSKKGQGYYLDSETAAKGGQLAMEDWPEEDVEWEILRQVLFEEETSYLELADQLYISDTLLTKIVAGLNRRMIRRHGQGIIRKQNGLLCLILSEEARRSYYTLYIMDRNVNHYFEPEHFQPFFLTVDLEPLKDLMVAELRRQGCAFYDTTIMRLLIGTAVMAERTAFGFFVEDCKNSDSQPSPESQCLLDRIGALYSFSFPGPEYRYFSRLFQNDFYYVGEKPDSQAASLLDKILIEINVEYGFDFSGDKEFCQEMTAQLHGALERSLHNQCVINPALSPIKSKYPLEYDIAIFFADRFRRLTGQSLSEDEISLFAVHFIRAMETSLGRMEQKAALINPYGKQIKDLIGKRLAEMGECRITIAYTWSIFDYPKEMPKDVFAVLATVPLPIPPKDVPVVLCRNFLDYHEKEKLLTVVKDNEVGSVRTYFKTLFKPSLFFPEMEFDSRQEVLAFLSRKLFEQGYVDQGFYDSVIKREDIAPTAFEPGFAFAHAMENNAARTAVSVCVLKNRISWGEYKVRIVFLFALASTWNHTIIPVYNVMIDNLLSGNTVHKLAKIKDCHEFMELLL